MRLDEFFDCFFLMLNRLNEANIFYLPTELAELLHATKKSIKFIFIAYDI